jgi:hypothetical protein
MSDLTLNVTETERGRLRLFGVEADHPEAHALIAALDDRRPEDAAKLVQAALGTPDTGGDWLFVVRMADLGELGLDGYLSQGHEVPRDELDAARPALSAATGTVLVVDTRAFTARPVTLAPAPFLTPLAEVQTDVSLPALPAHDPAPATTPGGSQTRFAQGPEDGLKTAPRGYLIPGLVLAAILIFALFAFGGG